MSICPNITKHDLKTFYKLVEQPKSQQADEINKSILKQTQEKNYQNILHL